MVSDRVSDIRVYRRLLGYVTPLWYAFALSIAGYLVYSLSNVAFVQLLSYIVDSIDGKDPLESSRIGTFVTQIVGTDQALNRTVVPVSMVLIALLRGIGSFCGQYFISYVATNVVHELRCQLFDQMLKLPSAYYDRSALGHMVARVTYHVTQVTGAATDAVKVLIREGFTVIGYLSLLLYLNWRLTLIFFLVSPIIALLVSYAGKRFRRISQRIQISMGDVTHVASESIQGYRVVRTFGGSDYERDRFNRVSNDNRRQSMKMTATAALNSPVIQLLVAGVLAALVWLVLEPVLLADMTSGKVIAFLTTSGLLAKPIRQLAEVNATIQRGLAAAEDIFDLYDEDIEADLGTEELQDVRGKLEFRNVSFKYHNTSATVLNDISFVVSPGQTIAIVGRSGSGKSTLASLIPRFYVPVSGEILIDDMPINDIKLENLRKHIAVVTQQITLFNDTVERNIAYGDLDQATATEIRNAAERAYAWEFIEELDDGLGTIVGDDGAILSGGQRQRMAIARAFLKDAPILILDEATSALDSESEKFIQAALEEVAKNRTTIVIAHRLSTIEKADLILVMEDGRIVGQGDHQTLIQAGGSYAKLYHHQFASSSKDNAVGESKAQLRPDTFHGKEALSWGANSFNPLVSAWYQDSSWVKLFKPLSFIYEYLARRRRKQLTRRQWRASIPVIIVGNISVGGTGKSPLVMWIADRLIELGYKPGVVSRGYGGNKSLQPLAVGPRTDPNDAGEEAVMIARRTGLPVVVDTDRVNAVQYLQANHDCNVVISDDGLQHYALARDVEIAVIDGVRGLGNGLCFPAGPLREPPSRLSEVDVVVINGSTELRIGKKDFHMDLVPDCWINLHNQNTVALSDWQGGPHVHALAGIGHPDRFFESLEQLGFMTICHPYEDHHVYQVSELLFDDGLPVIMTEKDAVKCRLLTHELMQDNYWYLKVKTVADSGLIETIREKLTTAGHL